VTGSDRRAWGRAVWLRHRLPSPGWSPAAHVADPRWRTGRAFESAIDAARTVLGGLGDRGMRRLDDDPAAEARGDLASVAWAGDRIAVLVAIQIDARLSGLIFGVAPGLTSIAQLIRRGQRTTLPMVSSGGFWLSSGDRPALDEEVGAFLAPLIHGLGGEPGAVDLAALGEVLRDHERRVAAAHQVPWLRQHADDAWEAGRWADYLSASDRLAAFGVEPGREQNRRSRTCSRSRPGRPPMRR
jgi:hypothetical protein